jgi:hypothetical protein
MGRGGQVLYVKTASVWTYETRSKVFGDSGLRGCRVGGLVVLSEDADVPGQRRVRSVFSQEDIVVFDLESQLVLGLFLGEC